MGDSEYLLAFQNIVIPIAYEFQPQLVLVSAGFDAAVGDPLGGYRVTPAMYGYMTHQLSALAEGRVVVALEGGYNLSSISDCATQCARALLGDPLPALLVDQDRAIRDSALQTVRDVIREQRQFWQCLAGQDKVLPLEVDGGEVDDGVELAGLEDQLDQLSLGTSRSVVRSQLVKQMEATGQAKKDNEVTVNIAPAATERDDQENACKDSKETTITGLTEVPSEDTKSTVDSQLDSHT
eukprot:GFUD01139558.1.p1 GENE.GFUD01139558.1~~GFUD01139558.1.p1  ORF type:complete len:246 (-),score=93.81 GFUD01139558.1:291-1004(-)